MKQAPEKPRKPSVSLKAGIIAMSMIALAFSTPLNAHAGPDDVDGWFSHPTQSANPMTVDFRHDGMNMLLARVGGQGKGYGAKDGTGTPERPRDGSGYGAGFGKGAGDCPRDGSGKGSGRGAGGGNN